MSGPELDLGTTPNADEEASSPISSEVHGFAPSLSSQSHRIDHTNVVQGKSDPGLAIDEAAAYPDNPLWRQDELGFEEVRGDGWPASMATEPHIKKGSSPLAKLAAGLLVVLVVFLGTGIAFSDRSPNQVLAALSVGNFQPILEGHEGMLQALLELTGMVPPQDEFLFQAPSLANRPKPSLPPPKPDPAARPEPELGSETPTASQSAEFFDNPYKNLPNSVLGFDPASLTSWKAGLKAELSLDAKSELEWPKYRAVQTIMDRGISEALPLLEKILDSTDLFWLKMRTIMAMARIGKKTESQQIATFFANETSNLIANFFKRFQDRSTPSERYILRESIKVAPPIARREILKALIRFPDSYSNLYAAAGTMDYNPKVQEVLAANWPAMPAEELGDWQLVAEGKANFVLEEIILDPGAGVPQAETDSVLNVSEGEGLEFDSIIIYEEAIEDEQTPVILPDIGIIER